MSFPTPQPAQVIDKRNLPSLPTPTNSRPSSQDHTNNPVIVAKVSVSKALPQPARDITSPRREYQADNDEIARLRKELEEEKKKTSHLEANLATSAKMIKQLEAQLAKEKSELEFLKNKIATAIVRKESTNSDPDKKKVFLPNPTTTSTTWESKEPKQIENKSTNPVGTKQSTYQKEPINMIRPSTQEKAEKTNTYRDPRLTQSITKMNNIMTKIILDVIGGDFDVASARTFDSIIDEITEICEPEFTKMKNLEEKKAMFQMLDDFEDISMNFTKIAMKLRSDPDDEELLTKLDHKTKLLEELLDDLGGVLFEKPEIQLERMSRMSRITSPGSNNSNNNIINNNNNIIGVNRPSATESPQLQKSRSRIVNRSTTSKPFLSPDSQQSSSPQSTSPTGSGSFPLPNLPTVPQPEGNRVRATEFSCPVVKEETKPDEKLLNRQSKKLARASVKLMNSERQALPPEAKAEERRQSRIIRKSITARTPELEAYSRVHSKSAVTQGSADVALHTSATNPITGKWQPRMGPNSVKRKSTLMDNLPDIISKVIVEEEIKKEEAPRVHRKSSILQAVSHAGLLSNKPQARHALVKPSVPVKIEQPTFENQYSDTDSDDDMSDDEDDEDLIAQREEFAALFGKSLKDLVKEKQDKQVWKQLELVGSLVNKCAQSSQSGSHVSKFLCSSIAKEAGNLITLLRTLGDGNMAYYDLADDVEDQTEEYTELSKKLYKMHLTKSKIEATPLTNSQLSFQKLLKSIAEFKQNEPKMQTMRGKLS